MKLGVVNRFDADPTPHDFLDGELTATQPAPPRGSSMLPVNTSVMRFRAVEVTRESSPPIERKAS